MTTSESNSRKIFQPPSLFYKIGTVIFLVGMLALAVRFLFGLGVTNMNDGYPWGIWITFEVVVGTALGCGGFLMAIVIYILHKWKYHPLIRSAITTSAFGYTIAGVSVIIDMGRYWNMYVFLMPWRYNPTSVLVEVALCIMAYTIVLWIEFLPVLLEKADDLKIMQMSFIKSIVNRINKNPNAWNKVLIVVISLGILLPVMHQTSLGSLMIVAGAKINPLWQSPFLPILFIISVAFMGYSIVIAESFAASYFLNRPYETTLIKKLLPWIMNLSFIWVLLRLATIFYDGSFKLLLNNNIYTILFIFEIALILIGLYILMTKHHTLTPRRLFLSSFLFLICGTLYRFNVYLLAFNPMDGHTYFPSVVELLATLGFLALEIMLYFLFIRNLPILPAAKEGY